MAAGAPPDAAGADDEAGEGAEPPVLFTVMGDPAGPYTLVKGDEDEAGEGGDAGAGGAPPADMDNAEGQTFDTPQELMKAIMGLLNNQGGAEASFAKGFKGEDNPTAAKPDMPPPGM